MKYIHVYHGSGMGTTPADRVEFVKDNYLWENLFDPYAHTHAHSLTHSTEENIGHCGTIRSFNLSLSLSHCVCPAHSPSHMLCVYVWALSRCVSKQNRCQDVFPFIKWVVVLGINDAVLDTFRK